MDFEHIRVVVSQTRLEHLIERFNTKAQAKFYIEHAGGDFETYEEEHEVFHRSLGKVTQVAGRYGKMKVIERKFLPNFLFSDKDVVVVVGQDGLVANVAKYAGELPILAVNPDTVRNDGILLPYTVQNFERGLIALSNNTAKISQVTMAEAKTNEGQHLLAFNDLFIGPSSHTSARYRISYHDHSENQSSSGLIVSTGAGSTGWLSSVFNMTYGVQKTFHSASASGNFKMNWDDDTLAFVVREPFQSKHSQTTVSGGFIAGVERLVIESHMPSNGIIFSDGVEADFLAFNAGTTVEIGLAKHKARLVRGIK
ncbi:NAD(+)/NADH kinase [Chryseolinea lacunae]|uniref:NAD(+)/NADH kinase n=1 Tax=Chryseolinea lacunae TaxID=2801331 RepID=A0ABS1KRX9_9BACT|nr:NAD(+)/NADH kinase [Chryseolinea lacunae]MBL0742007.1 NAD(+)/NADH kinase [Chryseolinea lacunae]